MNEQIQEPQPTAKVAEFLSGWEKYSEAVKDFRTGSLSTWGKDYFAIIANNESIMADLDKATANIRGWADGLLALGEEVAVATNVHMTKLWEYNEKVREIEGRPRRAFDDARDAFVKQMHSEVRSLAIKIGHAERKMWDATGEAREVANEHVRSLRARKEIAECLESTAQYLRWTEGLVFSADLVVEEQAKGARRLEWAMEQLFAKTTTE